MSVLDTNGCIKSEETFALAPYNIGMYSFYYCTNFCFIFLVYRFRTAVENNLVKCNFIELSTMLY